MISRGLAGSEEEARAIIMEGRLLADGTPVSKPGGLLSKKSILKIIPGRYYVSRGGYKIEGVFNELEIEVRGKNAADIGSSTGGFTDFLLKNGAKSVTAIDVGYGLLAWELRNNKKVRVMEKTNIRHLDSSVLEYMADLVVADVSFISIKKIFKKILDISTGNAEILLLVKPQFELNREYVRHKGVVTEKRFHIKALEEIVDFLKGFEIPIENIRFSRIKGASGNIEFWIYLRKSINSAKSKLNYDKIIGDVVNEAHLYFAKDRPYL